jgi:hypothetical protein
MRFMHGSLVRRGLWAWLASPALAKRVVELEARLDAQDEAWSAWRAANGSIQPPALTVIRGSKGA